MPNKFLKLAILPVLAIFLSPLVVSAHQPRLTTSRVTQVPSPEISKAYYSQLVGEPDSYFIESSTAFNLYTNILVPDIAGQAKDLSVVIMKDGTELTKLDGPNFVWEKFYEPFGADTYLLGPEYRARAEPGNYEIRVSSSHNDSKYSLAIGEVEAFNLKEGLNALTVIPELKKNFFNESPISFIFSPFGWGQIVALYFLAGLLGLVYRVLWRHFAKGKAGRAHKNISRLDRLLRLAIGLGLLLLAITTSWSPLLIFLSGFCLWEAIFSWCLFYAALGKNTCPLN